MKVKRIIGNKVIIEEISVEQLEKEISFPAPKEFWDEVHKKAVEFRNKKRKEYLDGKLSKFEMRIVEWWDERVRNLREEPLSLDIRLKK